MRSSPLVTEKCFSVTLWGITRSFDRLCPSSGYVSYPLLTLAPLDVLLHPVRLACLSHAASVHCEPGSNSSIFLSLNPYWHRSALGEFVSIRRICLLAILCSNQIPKDLLGRLHFRDPVANGTTRFVYFKHLKVIAFISWVRVDRSFCTRVMLDFGMTINSHAGSCNGSLDVCCRTVTTSSWRPNHVYLSKS